MTHHALEVMAKHGVVVANIPRGVFRYTSDIKEYEPLNIANKCPLIDKYCGVFETIAEKRLATHLL